LFQEGPLGNTPCARFFVRSRLWEGTFKASIPDDPGPVPNLGNRIETTAGLPLVWHEQKRSELILRKRTGLRAEARSRTFLVPGAGIEPAAKGL
jgi:hypothetical protein